MQPCIPPRLMALQPQARKLEGAPIGERPLQRLGSQASSPVGKKSGAEGESFCAIEVIIQ